MAEEREEVTERVTEKVKEVKRKELRSKDVVIV